MKKDLLKFVYPQLRKLKQPELGEVIINRRLELGWIDQAHLADVAAQIYYEQELKPFGGYTDDDPDHETIKTRIAQTLTHLEPNSSEPYNSSKSWMIYIQEALFPTGNKEYSPLEGVMQVDNPAARAPLVGHFKVYATSGATSRGEFLMGAQVNRKVAAPLDLVSVSGAFGFEICGLSMMPRLRPGDVLWIDPRKEPKVAALVLLSPKDSFGDRARLVGELVSISDVAWVVSQLSPKKSHTLPKKKWPTCQVVISISPFEGS